METGKDSEATVTLREDILRFHVLYLERCDKLSEGERKAYEKYLNHLGEPPGIVNKEISGERSES